MNKIVFFLVAFAAQAAMAGIFYSVDDDGNVTRHEGDVPLPAGAIWQARCPRDADPATLSVVNGVVVVDPVKVNSVQAKLEASLILPRQEPTGIEAPVVVLTSISNAYGIGVVAGDDGQLITYVDHQSPRPDATEIARRQADAIAARAAKLAEAKAAKQKGNLQGRIAALEALLGVDP